VYAGCGAPGTFVTIPLGQRAEGRKGLFGRRKQEEAAAVEPEEGAAEQPGSVEGPYEVDKFHSPAQNYLELQDLMNARSQEGWELVSSSVVADVNYGLTGTLLLVWKKAK
jgi:hypothetical protein